MRSIDRLEQNRRMNGQKARSSRPPDEEMEDEMELRSFTPINTAASIFDLGHEKRFGGINTAQSIFDRKAVFHTGTN